MMTTRPTTSRCWCGSIAFAWTGCAWTKDLTQSVRFVYDQGNLIAECDVTGNMLRRRFVRSLDPAGWQLFTARAIWATALRRAPSKRVQTIPARGRVQRSAAS